MHRVLVVLALLVSVAKADPRGGYTFRAFGTEEGLENLSITVLSQTADSMLWVGTEDGLYRFDGVRFHRVRLPANWVLSILPVDDGLWVGTQQGLVHLQRDRVDLWGDAMGIPPARINGLAWTAGGLWVASDLGLYRQVRGHFELAAPFQGTSVATVWAAPDGTVVASAGREVAVLDQAGWRTLSLAPERIDQIAGARDGTIWLRSARALWSCNQAMRECVDHSGELHDAETGRLWIDHEGSLWVTTRTGLAHRRRDGWDVIDANRGLPVRSVINVFEDREGSLWLVGDTLYQRLGRGLWTSYASAERFPADTVWSIVRDLRGRLWLGTNRGVVVGDDAGWQTVAETEGRTFEAIADGGNVMYAASLDSRVLEIDRETRATKLVAEVPGEGIDTLLYADSTLWVGTMSAGLWRKDMRTTGRFARVELPGGTENEFINQIIRDAQGRIWVTGDDGLAVLDGDTWRRFTDDDGLAARAVAFVIARRSGELCIGYDDAHGVSCMRYATGSLRDIRHIRRTDGLTSDKIYFLGEDTHDRLYVGLGVGIDVIDGSTIDHFSSANGMIGDDCAGRAVWADLDGVMWFGTTRGMSRFDGAAYRHDDIPPAPILMDVAHDAGAVTVHFATPTYAHRSRLEQQVRLAPLESAWRPTTTNELRFAHLDPGNYVFEVRARFGNGAFGPTTAFSFAVPPQWWQTWWLRSIAISCALLGIGLVLGWRNRVTTRREAVRIRGQSEARFRALIEQNPDAVIVHRDNVLLYVNPKAVEMLGYASATELVGQPLSDIIVPDERSEIRSRVAKVLETGRRAAPRDTVLITASGKELMVEVTALRVDFDGEPAVLAIGRDVTERKELEARVMLSDRMASIGTLAAGIAHEINNPLAYIQGNLDLIREQMDKPDVDKALLRECLNDALEGAHRVAAIVKGVKMFSRLEGEDHGAIDIHRALESALRMASSELRQCCEVTKDLGEVTTVIGNEARLCQVFINLLVNAAHAMPTDRPSTDNRIRISTRMRDGQVIITIEDNGVGMPPEVSRRVFEPFFTTKEIGKGTGLGLSLCHGIIKALRGTIDFTSHVGQGTSFQIVLPAAPPPAGDRPPDATADAAGTSAMPGVLVIDDDDRLLRSFERTLQRHYQITAVPSAHAALEILQCGATFDIILCDLMMPEMTGMELHAKLLQTSPALAARMVFMTGGAFTPEARAFVESPSIRHVTKPFTYADLKVVLEGKIAAS